MRTHRWRWRTRVRLLAAVLATSLFMIGWPTLSASAAGGPDLAAGKPASASGANGPYVAKNVTDGDQSTYWESAGSAFPQWIQTDFGAPSRIDEVVLKLPASWGDRKETLSVQGSTDGTGFTTLVGSAAYAFTQSSGNTVRIGFAASTARIVRIAITANTGWQAAQLSSLEVHAANQGDGTNLALGRTLTASSSTQTYAAANANDGNKASYWESANNAFPQWLQADLGATVPVDKVVLKLPDGWGARTQTLKVQGSANGTDFTDLTASQGYDFTPANGLTVPVAFGPATTRYLRVLVSANTVQPGAQLSELEIYGPATGDTQPPTAPRNLAYSEPSAGQIRLTWDAATDDTAVTGYDIYANGELRTSVAGNVTAYTDTQPASATVTYVVRAKDAAGNQSGDSNSVTRKGSSGDTQAPTAPSGLAFTEPAAGQIKLAWTASSDNVGVTGYDVYANNQLLKTVAGDVTTYTDSEPVTVTVSYYVRARDAAGNQSAASNTVTRNGTSSGDGSNLAVGKPITASSAAFAFVAENADDNNTATYWESAPGGYPSTLTVKLGANADTNTVVLKLNPDSAWGRRTQNIEVLGREQSASSYTGLVPAKDYTFDPASGNTVAIPVAARVADVQLRFTSNTGATGGQIAEFQVVGVPAPNPDLEVTALTASPSAPVESDAVTLAATVHNKGTSASPATTVAFQLGGSKAATATVGALAAGAAQTVSASIGTHDAGTYPLSAVVDPDNTVIEQNETNNSFTGSPLVIKPVDSSDLVAAQVAWSPSAPSAGQSVAFSVTLKNQGTLATAGGSHPLTLTLLDDKGAPVKTLTGAYDGALAPGTTAPPVSLGNWTAVNGKYTAKVVIADDANELPVKRANNTSSRAFFVGRGASMPYDTYEAEDGVTGGGAQVVGPNRTIGDLAGEASGRRAVTLNSTGNYVEFTARADANSLVTRFSLPDAPGGGGINATLDLYVDGTFRKAIDLTSKYMWQYGAEASPSNSPGSGGPRHIYDEANVLLGDTVKAGSTIRLQKDAANSSTYAIDFIDLEQVSQVPNPDPAAYAVPSGTTQQDVQNALDAVRMDTTGRLVGVYLPPGTYATSNKFQVYGKAVKVVGAGPWFTRFATPADQENTDAGFDVQSSANGSSFTGFGFFGNYTSRNDGPGKVFNWSNVANMTIDNVWVEHMMCLYWGTNTDHITIENSRVRDLYADGINLTNGSSDNTISNVEARSTGDDSFALFPATDINNADETGNVFQNLSALLTWRAAGFAVYGGTANTFRNLYAADTLTYPGLTIGTLKFGSIPALGFGSDPTNFQGISLVRAGGHFWGAQAFGALWMYSAEYEFQGIRVSDLDITDPTYSGIMFQTKYNGGTPLYPVKDSVLTHVSISGAKKSGDAFDAKSGFGIWANEQPEPGQGPAVGEVTFNDLKLSGNAQDIRNTTSTFKININP
ncbi:Secreted glycosyl hydrolase [Streptomyces sp. SDr-06]|uniref:discoidin domain-containing protein n=1 Tax=Streptomyces sp. SDr-06 TaxID=2267702 RepID=UPI000DEB4FA7|nr:discoidin domain-containing protein [Streptomyces sp. SDr-06]RCH65266.1 Secreted glycosyl hydrolase [Streptomyces sp. SDr-06]